VEQVITWLDTTTKLWENAPLDDDIDRILVAIRD
jgi:hypothetical protein